MKQELIDTVKQMVGHEYLYFDTPVIVRATPHTIPCNIWAICISPKDEIFLMDSYETWNKLDETDRNYSIVIASLNQRVQFIFNTLKKAV